MMLGEHHRPNPTVHIPPWPVHDEPNHETYSPSPLGTTHSANPVTASDYSPYHLKEALRALQRYLPSIEPDFDSDSEISGLDQPDSPVDAYSCDHFRMYEFKVRRCARGRSHDWTECPYAHPGEKARRRDPRKFHYSGTACPEFRKGNCKKGDSCEFAHGVFECWLHPARYRTQPCKDGVNCRRRVCFFAHTPDQLRVLAQQSPREIDSYDGSPLRAKTLPFLASPRSISPPTTSPSDSPPHSLSRSLGSGSIHEMVASFRNLQLSQMKSLPRNVQVGGSGFGSPRGPVLRPVFSSLPNTPTYEPTHSGIGYWDRVVEEEPVMERVESGRGLRAMMFEKLSKENSLEPVESEVEQNRSGGGPDVDWVSELVK